MVAGGPHLVIHQEASTMAQAKISMAAIKCLKSIQIIFIHLWCQNETNAFYIESNNQGILEFSF
jgi:hypothetical protein